MSEEMSAKPQVEPPRTPTDASGERERIVKAIAGCCICDEAAEAAADRIVAMRPEPAREEEEGCTIRDILNLRTPASEEP